MAFAITVLALSGVSLVLKIIFYMIFYLKSEMHRVLGVTLGMAPGFEPDSKAVLIIVTSLILGVLFSEFIIYPLYLRSVAKQIKDRYLEGGCFTSLGFACGALVGKLLVVIIAVAAIDSSPGGGSKAMFIIHSILKMAVAGVIIVFGLFYMRYIQELRSKVY